MEDSALTALAMDPVFQKLSTLEQVKVQAQVLVPIIRALRKELGKERADQIVNGALRDWQRRIFESIGSQIKGTAAQKFSAIMSGMAQGIGSDVDFQDPDGNKVDYKDLKPRGESFDFNIVGCRYADFFRKLGEPELGAMLLCDGDFDVIDAVGGSEVTLKRTQTIMKGASYCDFRYRMKAGKP
jgi:hypothetical protein